MGKDAKPIPAEIKPAIVDFVRFASKVKLTPLQNLWMGKPHNRSAFPAFQGDLSEFEVVI